MKWFPGGVGWYRAGSGHFKVPEDRYLVLNEGQPYEIIKDSKQPVESFIVFFQHGLAADVWRSLHESHERLLDDPAGHDYAPGPFFERTYPLNDAVGAELRNLRACCDAGTPERLALEHRLRRLLETMNAVHSETLTEVATIAAARTGTRKELYRRLHVAKEYITAMCDRPFSLDSVATAACMSKNHLLRTFQQLFGSSPHQYYDHMRLQEAKRLLSSGRHSVSEVSMLVGYQSLGTFSARFRRLTGVAPSQYAVPKRVLSKKSAHRSGRILG